MPSIPSTVTVTVSVADVPVVRVLAERLTQALSLLEAISSDYECALDSTGWCSAHGNNPPCAQAAVRAFLAVDDLLALGEARVPGNVVVEHIDVEFPAGTPVDPAPAAEGDPMRRTYHFHDPIHPGMRIVLYVNADGSHGVEHHVLGDRGLHCPEWADVTPELDAWFCPHCLRTGRISGAWVRDCIDRVRDGLDLDRVLTDRRPPPPPPPPADMPDSGAVTR